MHRFKDFLSVMKYRIWCPSVTGGSGSGSCLRMTYIRPRYLHPRHGDEAHLEPKNVWSLLTHPPAKSLPAPPGGFSEHNKQDEDLALFSCPLHPGFLLENAMTKNMSLGMRDQRMFANAMYTLFLTRHYAKIWKSTNAPTTLPVFVPITTFGRIFLRRIERFRRRMINLTLRQTTSNISSSNP